MIRGQFYFCLPLNNISRPWPHFIRSSSSLTQGQKQNFWRKDLFQGQIICTNQEYEKRRNTFFITNLLHKYSWYKCRHPSMEGKSLKIKNISLFITLAPWVEGACGISFDLRQINSGYIFSLAIQKIERLKKPQCLYVCLYVCHKH